MTYILSLKAKRIRPTLTLLSYQAVSGKPVAEVMNIALAVELFHNFTLMHDDIMDRAPVRRGKPCVHIVWNEDTAILSGDALLAYSIGLVVKDAPHKAAELVSLFTDLALGVCEGQMEDMDMATESDVAIARYIEMIRKKTAVLLGGSMQLGALAAGADPTLAQAFYEYGENLGIAFQLQDDLMDAFPPTGFGKQIGGDIIENKQTYLLLKAFELADTHQKQALQYLMEQESDEQKKVNGVLDLFKTLEIDRITRELSQSYFEKAQKKGEELMKACNFTLIQEYLHTIINRKI